MEREILIADVAQVKFGTFEIEGLKFSEGDYGIAVPQVAELFQLDKNQISRSIKALLGVDFQFGKAKTPLNSKAVNTLRLAELEKLILDLALIKRNVIADGIVRALFGLSLYQLYCDAFGIKLGAEDRQQWLLTRSNTKQGLMSLKRELKAHGLRFSHEFGEFVGTMQSYVGLPNGTRDSASLETLQKLDRIQIQLTELMQSGVKPYKALAQVSNQYC